MKNLFTSFLISVALFAYSFTASVDSDYVGTYGVSASNPARIELVLNEDHSFTYQDFSVPYKAIDIQGTWEVKRGFVVLKNPHPSFHNKWKITKDGMVAKSRKGLTFYRLRRK